MIDRKSRAKMLQALDDLMEQRITIHEFGAIIFPMRNSQDRIVDELEDFLDDCFDYYTSEYFSTDNQQLWKSFNRVRLILSSEVDQEEIHTSHPIFWRQGIAILLLFAFAFAIYHLVIQSPLVFYVPIFIAVPLTAFAFILLDARESNKESLPAYLNGLYPFATFSELSAVRRSTPDFVNKRFPGDKIPKKTPSFWRRLRDNYEMFILAYFGGIPIFFVLFVLFSPLVLFHYALPKTECETFWTLGEKKFAH